MVRDGRTQDTRRRERLVAAHRAGRFARLTGEPRDPSSYVAGHAGQGEDLRGWWLDGWDQADAELAGHAGPPATL